MNTSTQDSYKERILKVLIHIQKHLDDELALEDLAEVACFSPFHFHRVFTGMVGESVKSHVRRLRLERAASRLKSSQQSITQIAFEAGYESHEAFTRAFKSMFGASPTEFREHHSNFLCESSRMRVHYSPTGGIVQFEPLYSGAKPMDAKIEKLSEMNVVFIRHTGPYCEVGEVWNRLCAWAGPRGLLGPDMRCVGVCYDDPEVTPHDKIRYDACLVTQKEVQAEGEVGVQTIGGQQYAITMHSGPYENLGQTYARLCGEWLPAHNREPEGGPSLEFYLNSPQHTRPEDLRTQVCVPLRNIG